MLKARSCSGETLFPVEESTGQMAIDTSISDVDTWRAMERLVQKGKVRSLGVSNFDQTGIEQIMKKCEIVSVLPNIPEHRLIKCFQSSLLRCIRWSCIVNIAPATLI